MVMDMPEPEEPRGLARDGHGGGHGRGVGDGGEAGGSGGKPLRGTFGNRVGVPISC
jgi:hypothetical protein